MEFIYSRQFKKDLKKSKKQRKDFTVFYEVLNLLATRTILPVKFQDHALSGMYKGYRDLHLEPDWILIYRVFSDKILLARLDSHSELF